MKRLALAALLFAASALSPVAASSQSFNLLHNVVPVVGVTQRAPGPTDDSAHGYAVGNLWNVPGMGMWICQDATAGAAIWEALPTGILPLDSVPGVVLHGVGTRLLRHAYTGAPLQVAPNGSTTSVSVPFDTTGNIDVKALASDIGAIPPLAAATYGSPQMWSGQVTTWYDQTSGTAENLTVPTGTNVVAPQISPLYTTGGSPVVAFADGGLNWLTDYGNASPVALNSRLSNTADSVSSTSFTTESVVRNGSAGAGVSTLVTFQNTYPIAIELQDAGITAPFGGASVTNGSTHSVGMEIPSTPSVFGATATSSALTAFDDDNNAYSGPALISGQTTSGIMLGGQTVTANGFAEAPSAIIWGPALTAAQQLALRESLTDTFRLTPQVRQRMVVVGDSRGSGADGWETWSPARFMEANLDQPWLIYNCAIPGTQIGNSNGTSSTSQVSLFPTMVKPLYESYAPFVVYNEGGANSLGGAAVSNPTGDVANALADWTTYTSLVRSLGTNVRIVAQTVWPHASITPDSLRTTYNAALLTAPYRGLVNGLADEAGQPTLGNPAILTNRVFTGLPSGLAVHGSPYFQSMEGAIDARAVNAATGE